jgi:hypothetical protein
VFPHLSFIKSKEVDMGNWTTLTQSFNSPGVGARPIVERTLHGDGYKIIWTGEIAGGPPGSDIETPIETPLTQVARTIELLDVAPELKGTDRASVLAVARTNYAQRVKVFSI